MSTCPYCDAETRPGDNFCLNCGNRLTSANSSPQQAQNVMGDSTIPEADSWMQPASSSAPSSPMMGNSPNSSSGSWSDMTVANTSVEPTQRSGEQMATQAATIDKVANPARFVLRAENGDVLQEYPLEKYEISIGRAPTSDILLSKDKLTSRRHATVRFENGQYILRDEHSANGTFVNGQQLEEMVPRVLQDGDHVGIGEHELIFHGFSVAPAVEDMPTISVPYNQTSPDMTYRTREASNDEDAGVPVQDDFSTRSMDNGTAAALAQDNEMPTMIEQESVEQPEQQFTPEEPVAAAPTPEPEPAPSPVPSPSPAPPPPPPPSYSVPSEANVTFSRLTSLAEPSLPDMSPLMASLSALDGQVMSLQEQLNTTQEALHNHEAEIANTTNQLRNGVRRVSERMDSTIADVARNREALAWAELLQLMEDVMNNPRDIEYVTKLARKARELNKVFQMHQSVLNTLAECNSLLRSLIGEDR